MRVVKRVAFRSINPLALLFAVGALANLDLRLWNEQVDISPVLPDSTASAYRPAAGEPDALAVSTRAPNGDLSQTTARPLFLPTRRPPEHKPPKAPEPEPINVASISPPEGLRLVGVIRTGSGNQKALIRTSKDASGHWLATGNSIEGWLLREINSDEAVLEAGDQSFELRLNYAGMSGDRKNTRTQ